MKVLSNINNGKILKGVNGLLKYKESTIEYVDYLEGTGTQWIDTGIGNGYTLGNLSLGTHIQKTGVPVNYSHIIFGRVAKGGIFSWWGIRWQNSKVYLYYASGSTTSTYIFSNDYIDNKTGFEINNGIFTIKNITRSGKASLVMDTNIYLFKDTTHDAFPGRVWETTISYGGTLVADMKPCVKDGVACMHDVVRGVFIYNSGTGDFLYGND